MIAASHPRRRSSSTFIHTAVSLLDRFRPKWQHSDTEVRAAAVRQLGKEDLDLLSAVALGDEAPRVRRIAMKKLDDPKLLLEIGRNDPDESLRAFAKERACGILVEIATADDDADQSERAVALLTDSKHLAAVVKSARLEHIRKTALQRLSDDRVLAEVVTAVVDLPLRDEALGRITEPSALRVIASENNSELALAAVERIDDPEVLEAIVEERSANKTARRRAKEKLMNLVAEDHPLRLEERRGRLLELCREVELLIEEPDLRGAVEKSHEIQSRWESSSGPGGDEEALHQRLRQACDAIRERAARQEKLRAEQEQKEKDLAGNLAAREALCERVEGLQGETVPGALEAAQSAWADLGPATDEAAKPLQNRFASACENCRRRYQESASRRQQLSKFEALAEKAEHLSNLSDLDEASRQWPAIKKQWPSLEPPSGFEEELHLLAARFESAGEHIVQQKEEERARKKQMQQENLEHLRGFCERMEALSNTDELKLKDAFKELIESQTFLKEMGPLPPNENRKKWRAKLADARHKLQLSVQDFRETDDWRRWANVDLQEKLIQRMEALLETEDLRDTAKQFREIQLEWKQVSAVPRAQAEALWQRFKKAREEVRARCDAFFSNLDTERAENLARKNILCEKVEGLADSTDWEKTAQEIKSFQEQWKSIGAVPQKESNRVWKRFRKACDNFFDRRKEHYEHLKQERDENLERKIELCEKAEALADSTEWSNTAEELKRLQARWKQVGPVPRKKSDTIWKRFRKACDHFFDRYKRRDEVELADNLQGKEDICQELESLLSSTEGDQPPSSEVVADRVKDAWSRWKQIGLIPKEQEDSIEKRFRDLCGKLVSTSSDSFQGTELDPFANRKKRERLCERLEELVSTCAQQAAGPGSLDDLADRLKNALAARTIGGEASGEKEVDWRDVAQQVKRLKSNWERLGPVPGEVGEALTARFRKAYTHFFELRPHHPGPSTDAPSTKSSAR